MKTVNFGIGFITGRANVCNIINNTYKKILEELENLEQNVNLTIFILYDLNYQKAERDEFYKLIPDVYNKIKIQYITPENIEEEKKTLIGKEILTPSQANMFFGCGYGKGRNTLMYYGLKNRMDYFLFWDDDEYPVACIEDRENKEVIWKSQSSVSIYLKYIEKADVTIGYHCGYISPIPYVELNEDVDEEGFRAYIEALGNDIISWDSIREKFKKYNGVTYADPEIANGQGSYEIKGDGVAKWVAGSTLCLNLRHINKIPAFYSPEGARGEDTFFSTNLNQAKVIKIPTYHFHDGFLKYTNITKEKYPKTLRKIKSTEEQIEHRFYQASRGWVKYKPLFEYIVDNKNYRQKMEATYDKLKKGIPEVNKLFDNSDFNILLDDLKTCDQNVKKHYKEYLNMNEIWNKLKNSITLAK